MNLIGSILFSFLLMGIVEALIKPIAKQFVKRRVIKILPEILDWMDDHIYELIIFNADKGPEELEKTIRRTLEDLTGESWEGENIDEIFSAFDLRKTFEKLAK